MRERDFRCKGSKKAGKWLVGWGKGLGQRKTILRGHRKRDIKDIFDLMFIKRALKSESERPQKGPLSISIYSCEEDRIQP